MIFDTKRKAEAKAPAHQTTNTYYIMKDTKRKRLSTRCLHSESSHQTLDSWREPRHSSMN